MAKDVETSEFYELQQKVREINENFCELNFFKKILYWFPYRRKDTLFHIKPYVSRSSFEFLSEAYFGWGINPRTLSQMKRAIAKKRPFFFVEDGFVRSLYHGGVASKYCCGRALTIDTKAPYYCGDLETDLECNIARISTERYNINKIHVAVKKIIDKHVSKYNHQPIAPLLPKDDNERILVLGQNYGDKSLQFGGVQEGVFDQMIEDALSTGATVYYKVHPDVIDKNRETRTDPRVHFLRDACNPISLLEQVDRVYVATSQMGFEALLLGKPVKVYGKPFYAGWGVTEDVQEIPRRKGVKTVEDIFFATYVDYSYYLNLEESSFTSLEGVIDEILFQRKECLGF